ncbi:hypothetical protein ES703_48377 [subsurface metagenome]
MSIGLGIIIFFLSFVALIAEFFIYMALGVSLSFTGITAGIDGLAWFFVGLMVLTGAIGILAPISAVIQQTTKKKGVGNRILLIGIGVVIIGYILLTTLGGGERPKITETPESSPMASETKQEVSPNELKEKVDVELIGKGFISSDWERGIYDDYITMKLRFINKTDKDIKGVQGKIIFYDIFDNEIDRTDISYDKGIPKNESKIWDGQIKYNQFRESDKKLRATEFESLKYEWLPDTIIYQDGSKETE